MTVVLGFPANDCVAALVQCMQARGRRVSASRYQLSLGFDGLAVGPSAWDTVSLVQAEMDKALKHVSLAYHALTGSLPWGSRRTHTRNTKVTSR